MTMKHTCPHCGEKTISPIKKAFAGNPQSKGIKCPNCGKKCTNELKSAVFHTIVDAIALVLAVFLYVKYNTMNSFYLTVGILAGAFVLTHIIDAFFFRLAPAIRLDYK